ncbi:MAG: phosphate/phosphite/phosphonate ABC transporter substrate-binding protein [Nitrosopumilus sp.]|nr:phosphate/phosphite/phosphonate ABC transporter substrate-binding protein [Nitrosopumilus sp.]
MILTLVATIAILGVSTTTVFQNAEAESLIPSWIKNNAAWWAEDTIDDATFLQGIEYLVENNIINVSSELNITDVDSITIGFIPVEKADELTSKAEVLEKFLESEIGIDVEIVVPTNYETIIEGMRFGHIDAAFMDTGPAWITHQRTGAEAVLAELVKGKVNYQATVWTLADNESINTLEDTVGKRVAFTSITGSSGFVRPMGTLVTEGHITIQGDDIVALEQALVNNFKSYTFAGGYKAALNLLLNGDVDVAFGSDIAPKKYLELEDQTKLRPVTTIGPVPSHVFMVSSDMSESTKDNLVDALIKLNYDENNSILTNLYGAEALVPTTTTMHIGEFGTFIDVLTGLDQKILDKYDKSK